MSTGCPPDAHSTAICRPAVGVCDVIESCDGTSDDCPSDGFATGSLECQAAAGLCPAVQCSGADPSCPLAILCEDGNECTDDSCDPGLGCVHPAVAEDTPCNDSDECSVGDQCSAGVCQGSAAGTITGTIFLNTAEPGNSLAGAFVEACDTTPACRVRPPMRLGSTLLCGLLPGDYTVTAFPPDGSSILPSSIGPVVLVGTETVTGADVVLTGPLPLPAGTEITNRDVTPDGIPVVYWNEPLTLTTGGCSGGTASYEMTQDGQAIRGGSMAEGPSGTYTATIAPLYPLHDYARATITLVCPDASTTSVTFDLYIDPSGVVRTVDGTPVAGARVTLLRADDPGGPFELVPDGSGMMSLANRTNPDHTDALGRFGWDVIAGYYQVRVEKLGCVAPGNPGQGFVESAVLTIPPAVTDLDVRLACPCVPVTDSQLVVSKLDTPPGDDKLAFKGRFVLPVPLTPLLDPRAYGLRLVLSDAGDGAGRDVGARGVRRPARRGLESPGREQGQRSGRTSTRALRRRSGYARWCCRTIRRRSRGGCVS